MLLFDGSEDAKPGRVVSLDPVTNRTYHYWHVFVPGLQAGQIYGYRAHGPFDPASGCGLIQPRSCSIHTAAVSSCRRATARRGRSGRRQRRDGDEERGGGPVAPTIGKGCAAQTALLADDHLRDARARIHPPSQLRRRREQRGTYAGLIEKIPYLQQLGITAVELLPVFQFDAQDCPPGRINYWGYAPVSFFAPHQAYSSRQDPLGPVDEFRDMVKALHRAGIEVILDVVFNHTAEGDQPGRR